jgi:hypothetical protein
MRQRVICAGLAVLMIAGTAGRIAAQAPTSFDARTYFWYAQMVAVDAQARTLTVQAPIATQVTRYISRFKAGDTIVIVWTANGGKPETGAALYVAKLEEMRAAKVDSGYLVPAEFVSADSAGKTITFKVALSDRTLSSARGWGRGDG